MVFFFFMLVVVVLVFYLFVFPFTISAGSVANVGSSPLNTYILKNLLLILKQKSSHKKLVKP